MEKIVETHICRHCGVSFDITDKDLEFYEKISPIFQRSVSFHETGLNGDQSPDSKKESRLKKYLIPSPTLCPDCRQQRRLSFRNERKLYKRKCNFSGKDIISIYSPDKPYKVYEQEIWWSDKWDAMNYGKDFDFNRSFFEQFGELMRDVPKMNLNQKKENPNSEYCNIVAGVKNCYLCFSGAYSENVYYANWFGSIKNSMDVSYILNSELCYQCVDIDKCYNCINVINSSNCRDCLYLVNCHNCKNCLFSTNLNSKEYYILNKKVDKNSYNKIIAEIKDFQKLQNYVENFGKLSAISYKKNLENLNSENCLGNNIRNSKNIYFGFDVCDLNNGSYVFDGWGGEDLFDFYEFFDDCKFCYKGQEMGNSYQAFFNNYCYGVSKTIYCLNCYNSSNLFGCVGLKNKSYCILNKQYTKEEYEKLVPKIIEHMSSLHPSPAGEGVREWGEFFPSSLSPFGYNETVAQEYFPLTRDEVISFCHSELDSESLENKSFNQKKDPEINSGGQLIHGPIFNWSDYEAPFPKVEKIIPANKLPENIHDIPDDILNWAIECEVTKKPFRIIKEELEFYRKHNFPIPRRHPDQRHLDRMSLRNPRKLFERICDCPTCEENHKNIGKYKEEEFEINKKTGEKGKRLQTTYLPEGEEIVYCEECYNKEVY